MKTLEDRVQYLIDLLEKCKEQLGYISESENDEDKKEGKEKEILKRLIQGDTSKQIPEQDSLIKLKLKALESKCNSNFNLSLKTLN